MIICISADIRRDKREVKQTLLRHLRRDFVGHEEDLGILGKQFFEPFCDGQGFGELAKSGIKLDEFEAGLFLDFLLVQIRECLLQIALGGGGIADPFLGKSQQRPDTRQVRLKVQSGTHLGNGVCKAALKVEEHAKVGMGVEVVWIERDYLTKERNGRLRFLLLQEFLNLLLKRCDLL